MPQLYWDTIELGDPVTPLSKPAVTRVQIAKFAGAAQDWSPLHIDDDFAKSLGLTDLAQLQGLLRGQLEQENAGTLFLSDHELAQSMTRFVVAELDRKRHVVEVKL